MRVIVIVCTALVGLSVPVRGEVLLNSFETPTDVARVEIGKARSACITRGATDGRLALRVQFPDEQWPSIVLRQGKGFDASDWQEFGGLVFDVTNPESTPASIAVAIDDGGGPDGKQRRRSGWTAVPPGISTIAFFFPIRGLDRMRAGPPLVPGEVIIVGQDKTELDWSNITALYITLCQPGRERTLIFDRIRLMPRPALAGIADRFGQYARADWPGKVKTDQDLQTQREAEERWLADHPVCPDRDEYGGWKSGPQLMASNFFRTAYVVENKEVEPPGVGETGRGRWWLVTPGGRLFYSLGVDVVNHFDTTPTHGREFLFADLPRQGDVLSPYRTDSGVRFYAMNLHRRYGPEWPDRWGDISLRRLEAWGFNTMGAWCDGRLFAARKVPYTVSLWHTLDEVTVIDAGHKPMPDPFDTRLAEVIDRTIASQTDRWKDDPWCLGYYVDNEPAWAGWGDSPEEQYQLARRILLAGADLPAKRAFISRLKERYVRFETLKRAWATDLRSWEHLEKGGFDWPAKMTPQCRKDLADLTALIADRYFAVVSAAMKKHAPRQLYLGCRFAPRQIDVVRAAAKYCDVISFNIYTRGPMLDEWNFTAALGKPCMITEFHFGALDRGMFHYGLVGVKDQAERGRAYQEYLRKAAALPAFVGCHWFQYADEPLTGRTPDGENFNIGLVSIVDEPYHELVRAAREINCGIYGLLAGGAAQR